MGSVVKQIISGGRVELSWDWADFIQVDSERSDMRGKMVSMTVHRYAAVCMTPDEAIELAHYLMMAAEQ